MDSKNHIFISYAHNDGTKFSLRLIQDLEMHGFKTWLDTKDIKKGNVWGNEIDKGLKAARAIVVVLTPGSYLSERVQAEWLDCLGRYVPIIPLKFIESQIHYLLAPIQYVDFIRDYDSGLIDLIHQLEQLDANHLAYLTGLFDGYARAQKDAINQAEEQRAADYQPKMDELLRIIRKLQNSLDNVNGQLSEKIRQLEEREELRVAESEKEIAQGLREERKRIQQQKSHSSNLHIVGQPFLNMSHRFHDRIDERQKLLSWLVTEQHPARIISIHGREGVGKTALLSKTLNDLESQSTQNEMPDIEGVICLDARTLAIP